MYCSLSLESRTGHLLALCEITCHTHQTEGPQLCSVPPAKRFKGLYSCLQVHSKYVKNMSKEMILMVNGSWLVLHSMHFSN